MLNEENVIGFMIGGALFTVMGYFLLQMLLVDYKAAKAANDRERISRENLARSSNAMRRGHRR